MIIKSVPSQISVNDELWLVGDLMNFVGRCSFDEFTLPHSQVDEKYHEFSSFTSITFNQSEH